MAQGKNLFLNLLVSHFLEFHRETIWFLFGICWMTLWSSAIVIGELIVVVCSLFNFGMSKLLRKSSDRARSSSNLTFVAGTGSFFPGFAVFLYYAAYAFP